MPFRALPVARRSALAAQQALGSECRVGCWRLPSLARRVRRHRGSEWKIPAALTRLPPACATLRIGAPALLPLASAHHADAEGFLRLPTPAAAALRCTSRIRESVPIGRRLAPPTPPPERRRYSIPDAGKRRSDP